MNTPEWLFDEKQCVNTDYMALAVVEAYDQYMAGFRDVEAENRSILAALNLSAGAAVLEIGCGTGRFARAATAAGHRVTAIDVSAAMLDYLRAEARREGLGEIATQQAGFLTMDFPSERFDAVVSALALHHLPDLWKLVALRNVARALKPQGQFLLRDAVFAVGDDGPAACFERFINSLPQGDQSRAVGHIKKEFSTLDWIMEGLLQRAGFDILKTESAHESLVIYHCRKSASARK